MQKFRRKPEIIETEQFVYSDKVWPACVTKDSDGYNAVKTSSGASVRIYDGDWIITDTNGDRRICRPDVFKKTYEPVIPKKTYPTIIKLSRHVCDDKENCYTEVLLSNYTQFEFNLSYEEDVNEIVKLEIGQDILILSIPEYNDEACCCYWNDRISKIGNISKFIMLKDIQRIKD